MEIVPYSCSPTEILRDLTLTLVVTPYYSGQRDAAMSIKIPVTSSLRHSQRQVSRVLRKTCVRINKYLGAFSFACVVSDRVKYDRGQI